MLTPEEIEKILKKIFGEGVACQYDYSLGKLSLDGITKRETNAIKEAIAKLAAVDDEEMVEEWAKTMYQYAYIIDDKRIDERWAEVLSDLESYYGKAAQRFLDCARQLLAKISAVKEAQKLKAVEEAVAKQHEQDISICLVKLTNAVEEAKKKEHQVTAQDIFDEMEKAANKNVKDTVLRQFMCFKIKGKAWQNLKSRYLPSVPTKEE